MGILDLEYGLKLKRYDISTFAHWRPNFYYHSHKLNKLLPFNSYIVFGGDQILNYKASKFPLSSCSLIPISSVWTLVVLNTIPTTYQIGD
jgi:hypothetical protein